jgi:hypothetical protein
MDFRTVCVMQVDVCYVTTFTTTNTITTTTTQNWRCD